VNWPTAPCCGAEPQDRRRAPLVRGSLPEGPVHGKGNSRAATPHQFFVTEITVVSDLSHEALVLVGE